MATQEERRAETRARLLDAAADLFARKGFHAVSAEAVAAHAYTVGNHVVFGAGQYTPGTDRGRALLAHELAHVVQPARSPALLRQASDVASVRSLHAEELETGVAGAQSQLDKKLADRRRVIDERLKVAKPGSTKAKALAAARDQKLEEILAGTDTIAPDHQKVIRQAAGRLALRRTGLEKAKKAWHRFDADFEAAGKLLPAGLTARDLKALVGQESLDLTKTDAKGGIVGIAQIGKAEAKELKADLKDREDPKKAIPLAARVLALKADRLDKALAVAPIGEERRKFIYAAYNAGEGTIAEAQRIAIERKRDGAKWDSLISGKPPSPLQVAIERRLPKKLRATKYKETTGYVEKVLQRQAPEP